MKHLIFIFFVLFFISSGLLYSQNNKAARVYVDKIRKQTVAPAIDLSGNVEFPFISEVASEVNGIVEKALIEEGDIVKKDQIILKMESDILEKEIESLQALYNIASEASKLKKWEYDRYDTLYETGDIPLRELKIKETDYLKSKQNCLKLKADLERSKIMLDKKSLRSPFNGEVVKKMTHEGNWLEIGETAAIIASKDIIDIVCHVPQSSFESIAEGDEAEISINNRSFKGRIFSKIHFGDLNSRTYPVKIRAKNEFSLANGMEVKVSIKTGKAKESFIVSRDALITRNDSYYIYVAKNSKAEEISVRILSYTGENAEIISDEINDNMLVITRGNRFLSDGQSIEIVK